MKQTRKIFSIIERDTYSSARTGVLSLAHGTVQTPAFMPVGTCATVKALTKDDLAEIGFEIILANTYHLYLRPGLSVIEQAGGLHGFSRWQGNFLTDSGGFQIFSLQGLRKITEEGVAFQSHIDGRKFFLTPEHVVDIQVGFNSDIQMQLDVCSNYGISKEQTKHALHITQLWTERAMRQWRASKDTYRGSLFPIVQGGFYTDLRMRSVEHVLSQDPEGLAIGGLSVGEPKEVFCEFLEKTTASIPETKPVYVMGIGTPDYILEAVKNGVDIFDCVLPSRDARNGRLFTRSGTLSIKRKEFEFDYSPIDATCQCKVCKEYSKAYLRHLWKSKEILYSMLATYHNLYFLHQLMREIRESINNHTFIDYYTSFLNRYQKGY